MKLDLPMYKEAYKNIAEQVKELDIIDNEKEIERLEKVIAENQANIEAWEVHENDQKEFENYAEPYNAKISEAQTKILELEKGIEENKKQQEENKESQKQLKGYMSNVRKNAENEYKEARKELEEKWENSDEKKQYDSKMETVLILQSKDVKTPEERVALMRLLAEVKKLKKDQLDEVHKIDAEYKQFIQDLDGIDKEYGINDLENENKTPENVQPENVEPENVELENVEPENIVTEKGTTENGAPANVAPENAVPENVEPENAAPENAAPENGAPTTQASSPENIIAERLDIKVTSQGISFNEENIEADDIVAKYKPEVEDYINKVNEEYNKDGKYDKNIIRAIAVKYYQKDDKGNIKLTLSGEKKLETYQKMVDKPEENKSQEHITYDLTKMSLIQRLLGKTKWKSEHINNFREVAYEADGKYAKVITDKVTELVWKIRRGIEKIKTARLTDGNKEKETIGKKIKSTAKSFRERLAKETPSEAKDLSGVGNNEPETKPQSKEDQEQEQ